MSILKFSIITPSFNQGKFIEETIKSVISQEGNFVIEYLIMDGGSTDETIEVLKKYEQLLKEGKWPVNCGRVTFSWVSERDKGQADAVNKGFRAARGDVLGWLNSDDTYLPGAFAKVADYFNANGNVMMVYGEGYQITKTGEIKERYYTEPFNLKRLAEICFISQPTVFLGRSVPDEVGYLNVALHFCMDYEYWIRIAIKGLKIGFIPEYLANTRVYAETKTSSSQVEINYEIINMLKKHFGYVPKHWIDTYLYLFFEKWPGGKTIYGRHPYFILRKVLCKCLMFRYNFNKGTNASL